MKHAQITSIRALCVLTLAAFATMPARAVTKPAEEGNAAVIAAESALASGDCKVAIQNYQGAVQQIADADLAERATQAALDCGQPALAVQFAQRWQKLAPGKARAALAGVRAELGLYHIAAARSAFAAWLDAAPVPDAHAVTGAIDLLEEGSGSAPTLALFRGLQHKLLADTTVRERLAALAYDGADFRQAIAWAGDALRGPNVNRERRAALQAIVARANAGLGRADEALKAATIASDLPALADTRADVLQMLGRDADARTELLKLRAQPLTSERAERRLAMLAFSGGNYADAEPRLNSLARQRGSAAFAIYYLGLLAERSGDTDGALQRYELLAGSDLDGAARRRVAGIYFHDNERSQAAEMLAPKDNASITDRIAAANALTELYSVNGAHDDALARLDQALERFPGNVDLEYQRSVLLARAERADAAIATLERLYKERPDDPTVANALGYTLADFKRDLPRAQKLIESALASQPDNAAILDSMGWVLFRRGQARESLPWFERAWRLMRQADIGAHWGEALWTLGREKEARGVWQQAIAVDPEDPLVSATAKRFHVDLQAPRARRPIMNGPSTSI